MSTAEMFIPKPIRLTEGAIARVQALLAEEGDTSLMLRIYVTGGGCSGFQYGFTLDGKQSEDDTVVEEEGCRAVVDALSFQYLNGSTVDFEEGLQGSRFVVRNPNAQATCSCGMSFTG